MSYLSVAAISINCPFCQFKFKYTSSNNLHLVSTNDHLSFCCECQLICSKDNNIVITKALINSTSDVQQSTSFKQQTNDTAHDMMHRASTNSNNINNTSDPSLTTSNNKSQVMSSIAKVNTTTNSNKTVVDNQQIVSDVNKKSNTTVSSSHNDSKQYEATKFCTCHACTNQTYYFLHFFSTIFQFNIITFQALETPFQNANTML
jgi:hypothetical protein